MVNKEKKIYEEDEENFSDMMKKEENLPSRIPLIKTPFSN